ncbi:hypothetical protein ACL7TT_19535 [Microbulbifer sp. 2304DJ12-6]|uniref:hypothetical protein n=1 Tax=Microbulbifer sp. 2304DJ12-6 TaxID=3233340 RepID=UPI0039AF824A
MEKQQNEVAEITITRNTKVGDKFIARGTVLKIGKDTGQVSKNDARVLLNCGKALPGKCNRTLAAVTAEKKATEAKESDDK